MPRDSFNHIVVRPNLLTLVTNSEVIVDAGIVSMRPTIAQMVGEAAGACPDSDCGAHAVGNIRRLALGLIVVRAGVVCNNAGTCGNLCPPNVMDAI